RYSSSHSHHHENQHSHQPWWQYYYQLYHYSLPPGRKPTVFGPYLLLQTLGEGEFGKVKFGIEIKTGQEVAIKLIRKDSIDSTSRMTKVEREISVLRVLHHPNIVELFDVIETEKYIGIILQCATGGELFDYILAHRYLKEKDASRLFAQLISGVNYMHKKHIVHRDLKLENLLLDRHRNVLITDFGFANQFSSAHDDLMSTSCGSPCYAAPELVMNQQGLYVGPAVDIWSCGVILFAMLCGYLPYDDDPANPESYNINLLYKYILNTPLVFPDYISEEACDLMSLMLVPDPEKRCSMETIMAHPWLATHKHLFVLQSDEEEEEELLQQHPEEEHQPLPQAREEEEEEEEEDQTMITSTISTTKQEKVHENAAVTAVAQSSKPKEITTTTTTTTKEEQHNHKKIRPKSTASSTEKVLHFLSGVHSHTSKSSQNKRTRHMSLVSDPTTATHKEHLHAESTTTTAHANASASATKKRTVRLSTTLSPPTFLSATPPPASSERRGTRRKTLSLLVNSMTEKGSASRHPDQPPRAPMEPSISEHAIDSTHKHRSAGKKFMDWFKKKPLSSAHQKTHPHHYPHRHPHLDKEPVIKLRTHHGAVDQEALTSRPPHQVFQDVKVALQSLGLEFKRDGSNDFKLKCSRPKNKIDPKNKQDECVEPTTGNSPQTVAPIYGDPNVDPGEE
ncbi:kinase-like domain-containing protein, partial [Mycotypha africana]|uniref:kinase-like domain-containing protein n=1 Tax=Mycotypha africana TaxID=64632 RepID=UPI002300C7E4